ncbi:MAG: hypothetical protein U0163_16130 [Gemmatimonadaceae bacterium]
MSSPPLKPVIWLGDSLRELKTFPAAVQDEMGYAIYLAPRGDKHVLAAAEGTVIGRPGVVSDHRGTSWQLSHLPVAQWTVDRPELVVLVLTHRTSSSTSGPWPIGETLRSIPSQREADRSWSSAQLV